jgi:DNA polymerase/3'-5' exonuclease PolX
MVGDSEKLKYAQSRLESVRRSLKYLSFLSYKMTSAAAVDYKDIVLTGLETMRLGELATAGSGAKFKAVAYKKAIDAIRRMDGPLTSLEDVKGLEGIGKKIEAKIADVLATGAMGAAERMKARADVGAFEILTSIHGIGPVKARDLISAGITSVADLRAAARRDPTLLTDSATLGLKYYEDGVLRIPRAEMERHEAALLAALPAPLFGKIVGSYRREAATSGDVDMLVSYPEIMSEKDASTLFRSFVDALTTSGYIEAKLAGGAKKWMGYVRLGGAGAGAGADRLPARRLDLLLTPPAEFAYALLYFTGSDKFNVAFRRYCLDLGYSLNEHTLTPIVAGKPAPPPMRTERDIFRWAGLKFVKPSNRTDGSVLKRIE